MIGFIKKYLLKKQAGRDEEYKAAVHYAYQHYQGDELDSFLKILDSLYDKENVSRAKDRPVK